MNCLIGESSCASQDLSSGYCRKLEKAYSSLTMEKLDTVLPAKTGELEFVKISSPHRGAVYFQDGVAMVLDTSGRFLSTCHPNVQLT